MALGSYIGIVEEDGLIAAVPCRCDGSPAHQLPLLGNYATPWDVGALIHRAAKACGIATLGASIRTTVFRKPVKGECDRAPETWPSWSSFNRAFTTNARMAFAYLFVAGERRWIYRARSSRSWTAVRFDEPEQGLLDELAAGVGRAFRFILGD